MSAFTREQLNDMTMIPVAVIQTDGAVQWGMMERGQVIFFSPAYLDYQLGWPYKGSPPAYIPIIQIA